MSFWYLFRGRKGLGIVGRGGGGGWGGGGGGGGGGGVNTTGFFSCIPAGTSGQFFGDARFGP